MARQRRSASPMRRQSPAPPSRTAAPPAPVPTQQLAHAPPAQPAPMMAQPQQPGLFAQMASTAAGVAVGSAVGHTVGHALTGAFSGGSSAPAEAAAGPAPATMTPAQQQAQLSDACSFELKQFVECAQNQHDITLCQGFNDVLKACKQRHGLAL